ncbi:MAG: hypothetical protein HY721_28195 [Planctomycetes bacterium]|nr:hypothetical protein [Planctomycetota bacterium]
MRKRKGQPWKPTKAQRAQLEEIIRQHAPAISEVIAKVEKRIGPRTFFSVEPCGEGFLVLMVAKSGRRRPAPPLLLNAALSEKPRRGSARRRRR